MNFGPLDFLNPEKRLPVDKTDFKTNLIFLCGLAIAAQHISISESDSKTKKNK